MMCEKCGGRPKKPMLIEGHTICLTCLRKLMKALGLNTMTFRETSDVIAR